MKKEIYVAFVSEKLKSSFNSLKEGKFEDKNLYTQIDGSIGELKKNPNSGIKIPKHLWPKDYIHKYGITNLWKYNLLNSWRLIYTIETNEIRIISIILEWFSHKDYERKFKY